MQVRSRFEGTKTSFRSSRVHRRPKDFILTNFYQPKLPGIIQAADIKTLNLDFHSPRNSSQKVKTKRKVIPNELKNFTQTLKENHKFSSQKEFRQRKPGLMIKSELKKTLECISRAKFQFASFEIEEILRISKENFQSLFFNNDTGSISICLIYLICRQYTLNLVKALDLKNSLADIL